MNKNKVLLSLAIASTLAFTYWFAFIHETARHPNNDLISTVFMGVFIGWAFWAIVAALMGLWNSL